MRGMSFKSMQAKTWGQWGRLSRWLGLGLLLLGGMAIGFGLAIALQTAPALAQGVKALDPVPPEFALRQQVYVERCGSCHVAIPPALLPRERWEELIQRPEQHFGVNLRQSHGDIRALSNIDIRLMWDYIRATSRNAQTRETPPTQVSSSRFFRALHPKIAESCRTLAGINCPDRITVQTCGVCHPQATDYDYRTLAPGWELGL